MEAAMYEATLTHPMTNLAPRPEAPARRRRPNLLSTLALSLAWVALAGGFLLDVARPPAHAVAGQVSACAHASAEP
jgi:hypothetical protein